MKLFLCSLVVCLLTFISTEAYALTSGTTTVGSIPLSGTSNQTFSGTAGQGVLLNVDSSEDITMTIKLPDTSVWQISYSGRFNGTLPVTGTYTVSLTAPSATGSTSYDLAYVRGAGGVSNGSLTSGATYNGTLATNGLESFQITATAGEDILLFSSASFDMPVIIYAPDGSYWSGTPYNRFFGTIPTTGTYTVVLYGWSAADTGAYKYYYVRGGGGVSEGTLTSGQVYSGSMALNEPQSFQITATAGQYIALFSSAAYDTSVDIYAPDGSYLSGTPYNRFWLTIPTTGTYTVVLYAYDSTDTGPYKYYYVRGGEAAGGGVANGPIESGQSALGTLGVNQLLSYQFYSTSGKDIEIFTSGASFDMYIEVYAPDGSYIGYGIDRKYIGNLPATGTYNVLVYAYGSTDTGNYRMDFFLGDSSVSEGELLNGVARSGTLLANGQNSYFFTGTASNSFSFTSSAAYSRYIELYGPNGKYLQYGSNSLSGTLPSTGRYTVTLYAHSEASTGAYTITASTTPLTPAASTASKVTTEPITCPPTVTGNPINFDVGFKYQTATDYDADGLTFTRIYRSDSSWTDNTVGTFWRHNYARTFTITGGTAASMTDGTGATTTYTLTGGVWVPDDPSTMATLQTVGSTYVYTLPDNTVEKYDSSKRLTRIEYLGGGALNLGYNGSSQLTSVTNESGRQITMTYSSGRVATLVTPDGTFTYTYGANANLTSVTKPDTKVITYHYENGTYVNALTGITDENSVRYATFTYNGSGKATRSEHAGAVDDFDVAYNGSGTPTVTNPLGKNTTYNFTNIQGVRRITQVDGAASTNCVASNRYYSYDDNGRVISQTDWENNVTRFQYDSRGNVTQIVKAFGTPEQQITTITYDSTYNLPDVVTEAGKTTDYDYDGFGRTTSVTVTDTATSETRTTSYTYWSNGTDPNGNVILGRLKQINGPRTDVTDTTDFAYDGNYNLTSITNALSQVTQITARDSAGRPTTIRDPNNIDTVLTYDTNGWLKTSTRASGTGLAAQTTYDYDFTGNLTKVTLPNSVYLEYSYDNAHRLTGVEDVAGNTITYTLDNAGNITKEEIKDASTNLKYKHQQAFDELSRIIQSIGNASPAQTAVMTYDKDGNLTTYTDPKTYVTAYDYDALWRLTSSTDALNGTVNPAYNGLDDMTSISDARAHTTTYTYNAFGDIVGESSPDRGSISYTVDKAGNVTQRTDARSVVTNYTYDAINRPLTVAYPAQSSLDVALTYDSSSGCGTPYKGRLCSITDAGGSYAYQWDSLGRMTQEAATRGGTTLTTSYSYDLAGNISGLTLPSGRTVTYTRNSDGRITGVSATVSGSSTTLASSGTYLPFGPMVSLTYGNTRTLTAAFDTDYNPTSRAVSTIFTDTYTTDKNSNITQAGTPTYGYDALNRVNAENTPSSTTYTYDLTDNRLTKVQGGTTSTTVPSTSNKISAVGGSSYTYDSSGNITADGTNTYTWNNEGQLATVVVGGSTVGTYTYDYLGRRTKKVAGGTTTLYIYGPGGLLYGEYTTAGALNKEYVYLDAAPLVQIASGSPEVPTYLHVDHLGTPRYGTNSGGSSVWAWAADAFGVSTPTGSATVNLRMPGQYYDSESGLFYNWNRYYKPTIGRYISPDPIGLAGGELNLFSYAAQSPAVNIDPWGLDTADAWMAAFLPAHTAPFTRNPIGGSTQSQLEYAGSINALRSFEIGIAGAAITSNVPLGGAVSWIGQVCRAEGNALNIQFGRVPNQTYHAFRHTDEIGLSRDLVRSAVRDDLTNYVKNISAGQFNGTVTVNGIKLNYSAFKLPNGTINVGRITAPK